MLHKEFAPPIRSDQMRTHGERGPCINCHEISPATQVHRQLLLATHSGLPQVTRTSIAETGAGGTAEATPGRNARGGTLEGGASKAEVRTVSAVTQRWSGIGPAIVEGTAAPHDWRGACPACHLLVDRKAGATTRTASTTDPWRPTPPLPARLDLRRDLRRDPPEAEAFGMSVWPTASGPKGLMVVEVEGMARRSGLMLGDIIRAVDGRVTTDVASFRSASRAADPGRGVVFDTLRNGTAKVVVVQ